MYFDSATTIKSGEAVSYNQLLQFAIESSDSISASEAELMTSEFKLRKFGSEGLGDWWAKIKAFFRKLWENIKTFFVKIVAYVMAIPSRISAFIKKIVLRWEKFGMEKKIKNLEAEEKKGKNTYKVAEAAAFKNTNWGIQDGADACNTLGSAVLALFDPNKKVDTGNSKESRGVAEALKTHTFAEAMVAMRASTDKMVEYFTEDHMDEIHNYTSSLKENIVSLISNMVDGDTSGKYELSIENLKTWYYSLKNDIYAKDAVKYTKYVTSAQASLEVMMKSLNNKFETAYKEQDEDKVQAIISALKVLRSGVALCIVVSGKVGGFFAQCAVNRAKMVNAALRIELVKGEPSKAVNVNKAPADSTPRKTENIYPAKLVENTAKNNDTKVEDADIDEIATNAVPEKKEEVLTGTVFTGPVPTDPVALLPDYASKKALNAPEESREQRANGKRQRKPVSTPGTIIVGPSKHKSVYDSGIDMFF